jgi:phospholipase C
MASLRRTAFLAAALILAACAGEAAGPASPVRSPAGPTPSVVADPCGRQSSPPQQWRHVVWIWFENRSYESVFGPGATATPYLRELADRCGLATNFHNETHPSLPNHLAAVAGTTAGTTRNCSPKGCSQSRDSLFGKVTAAGHEWRSYAESMPHNCALFDAGRYAVRHNPAAYFVPLRAQCAQQSVPMGDVYSGPLADDLAEGTLPEFAYLVPDLCHNMHHCTPAVGDRWLRAWMARLLASDGYTEGSTVVFLTWDEGDHSSGPGVECRGRPADRSCHIPTVVVSPSTRPGTTVDVRFDHYSLLRTTEELLGLPGHLGAAARAPSMRQAFGL